MKSIIPLTILFVSFIFLSHAQNWSAGVNAGGANQQTTTGVAEQADGSKIVVGDYRYSAAVFGSYNLPWSNNGSGATNTNSFIVKYSPTNAVVWATRIGSSFDTEISAVSVDGSGAVYVCGVYRAIAISCSFYNSSNLSSPATTLYHSNGAPTPTEGNRAFVAKYSASGSLIWARLGIGAGLTDDECLSEIAVSGNGSKLVVTGRIDADFPVTVNGTSSNGVVSDGSYVLWLNPADGTSQMGFNYTNDAGYGATYRNGLCIDGSNNVIVSGKLGGTTYTVKGYGTSTQTVSTNSGTSTLYAKYNASGTIVWARATRSTVNNTLSTPSSLVADDAGNVYIGGWMKAAATDYQFQFPSGSSTYLSIPVITSSADNVYVVKLSGSNGYALWTCFGKRSASGTEVVSLAKGPCDLLYVAINTAGVNPSFTDAALTAQAITSPAQANIMVCKLSTNGVFAGAVPWAVYNSDHLARGYIATYGSGKVHCAGSIDTPVSLQTSGAPITLTPNGRDMMLASLTDNSSVPGLTLNPTSVYCPYQTIPLSASATGTAPFTYTWSIYDNANGTFVNLGTTGSGSFNLTPLMYNPYIFPLLSFQVIYIRVGVTNCSGVTDYEYRYIGIKGPVAFTQVNSVEVCYDPPLLAPDAVFSVTGQYVDTYTWQYSPDGGATWFPCTGEPGMTPVVNILTIDNPLAGMNGYLFRCVMTGCSSVVSDPALLTVVPCPGIVGPGDPGDPRQGQIVSGQTEQSLTAISLYPNPADERVNLVVASDEDFSGEWAVRIYDVTGREIRRQLMEAGRCTIATDLFTEGHYLCVITHNGEAIGQQKLVIAH